jgi:PKD repeat protein
VRLTATDDDGATDVSSAGVDVEAPPAPNQAPTAAFDVTCDELECEFEDQSSDSDGQIDERVWRFGDGGTARNRNPDHEYPNDGTYTVTLTVTDDDDAEATATRTVTVARTPPPNNPPTADFATPSCTAGQSCQFTDGSRDSDGNIASRLWSFQDGTPSSSSDPNPSVTFASAGPKTVTLRVTDDDGAQDTETRQVTVAAPPPPPNNPPTAAFTPPTDCVVGQACTFTDASSDGDGNIASRLWTFTDGVPASSSDPNPSVVFSSEGPKSVTLTVTDDDGATNSSTQSVNVAPAPGELGLRSQPSSARNGELDDEPEVQLVSSTGREMRQQNVPVSVDIASGIASLGGSTTRQTDDNGRARFEDLTISGEANTEVTLVFTAAGFASVDSQPILIEEEGGDGED